MYRFRTSHRRPLLAALAGIGLAVAMYMPPYDLAARLDWAVFDVYARIAPPNAPASLLLVETDDSGTLVKLAARGDADLIVATWPEPPSESFAKHVLGPTEVPVGDQLLKRTRWREGGHLWFPASTNGVVRTEPVVIRDQVPIRSLAAAAATAAGAFARPRLDADDRHWLRFHAPGSFARLDAAALASAYLGERIIVIGPGRDDYRTPLGAMSATELVAQSLAGRLTPSSLVVTPLNHGIAWLPALALFGLLVMRGPPGPAGALLAAASGAFGLASGSAIAYIGLGVVLPIMAPILSVLLALALLASRRTRPDAEPRLEEITPIEARRLAADGRLIEAAYAYRSLPPSAGLLAEQYALAEALEGQHEHSQALALYHRIAQTDPAYRDVASRLATSSRGSADGERRARPETLSRYELLELIGQGTTGKVYLGRDPQMNRLLAIKVIDLRSDGTAEANAEAVENFRREAESAGRLSHPNIVTIYDVGELDGLAYIAMEYLRGRHLSNHCTEGQLLPVSKVLELVAIAAHALDYAHARNVVHRDIKPANIMYDSSLDELKITDFGIARLTDVNRTRTGIVLGTPSYMAPEQLEGENVNGHTDLFALGVTLYQLLTGRLPFQGASMTQLMFVIANEPHPPITTVRPGLPDALNAILDRALAKKPNERFASGAEMADALRDVAAVA